MVGMGGPRTTLTVPRSHLEVRLSVAERGWNVDEHTSILGPYCGVLLYCVGSRAYRMEGTKNAGKCRGVHVPGLKGRGPALNLKGL